jgi:hypothetical protein
MLSGARASSNHKRHLKFRWEDKCAAVEYNLMHIPSIKLHYASGDHTRRQTMATDKCF